MIKFSYKGQEYSLVSIESGKNCYRVFVVKDSMITYLNIEYLSEMDLYPEPV